MKYLKELAICFGIIILSVIITSIMSYSGIINDNTSNIINQIMILIASFISGFNLGKKKQKNGYLEGIKIGAIISVTFFIIRLIIKRNIIVEKIILYACIMISSIIGSIIGINKKIKA